MKPGRRLVEIVIVAVVVATTAATVANHRVNPATLATGAELVGTAESSAVYCTGFSGSTGIAPAEVLYTNRSARSLAVHVTIVANTGVSRARTIKVAPGASARLTATTFPGRAFYGVSALVDGGGVSAQVVGQGVNHDSAPCASSGSTSWGVAGLSTHVGTMSYLTLLNPTRTEATVDITALTPTAVVTPGLFQGIVVGPQAEVAVPLNGEVVDVANIALSVHTTRGAVVAAAAMSWTGRVSGAATIAGSSGLNRTRVFPDLPTNASAVSTMVLANPTAALETVSVALTIASATRNPASLTAMAITPFEVTLPAYGQSTLALSPTTRVPAGGPAIAVVRATGDVIAQLLTRQVGGGPWFSPPASVGTHLTVSGGFTQLGNLLVVNRTGGVASVTVTYLRARGAAVSEDLSVPALAVVAVGLPLRTVAYEAVLITSDVPIAVAGAMSGRPNGVRIVAGSGGG